MTFVAPYTLQDFVKFASTTKIMQCYGDILRGLLPEEEENKPHGAYKACIWGAVAIEAGLAVVIYTDEGFASHLERGPKWVFDEDNKLDEDNIAKHFGMTASLIIEYNDNQQCPFQIIATEVMLHQDWFRL